MAGAANGTLGPVVADLRSVDLENDAVWQDRFYIPSIRSLGDIETAAALMSQFNPRKLTVLTHESQTTYDRIQKAFVAASNGGTIRNIASPDPPVSALVEALE